MTRTVGPYFAPPAPRVFAHRGLATGALENSIEAFAAALRAGAGYLETDAHATADGIAVLVHDPGLRRIASLDLEVASLTLAQLREIGPVGGQICTLIDALRTFPSARFNIDVKSAPAADAVARAVLEADAVDRVLVASFSRRRRTRTLTRVGDAAASASAAEVLPALLAARIGLIPLVRLILRRVDAVQIPQRIRRFRIVTPRTVRAFHAAGVEVHVWTVNDPEDMRRLLDAGVDGIVTDRCDVLAEEVRRRS
ncbi:glycerophosphodiester phosphodiesterase family protein [Naasia sp. SYSU D00948]|uniref:glycerophosphodiester phosphodiesterase family protein n=1 Tax=Naasia sp. SYSU D00948 TaxID=2817379 RepID=UPI001B30DED2|nr:glycerophosphodiester phosphodiesterase family protein [Naasia sp. SYSU D00948]